MVKTVLFLIPFLFLGYAQAASLSAEDAAYKSAELGKLRKPDITEESRVRWERLVDIAAKSEDPEIADALIKTSKNHLDGYFSENYELHMTRFLKANPVFFVASVKKVYGSKSPKKVVDLFINETGNLSAAQLEEILKPATADGSNVHTVARAIVTGAKQKQAEIKKQNRSTQ